jgi:hypothetical protein
MNNKPRTGWEDSFSQNSKDEDKDLQVFMDIDIDWDDYEEKYGDPK